LLKACDRFVFAPATCAAFQMRVALKRFVVVQQTFRAGDHVVPAFSAVHVIQFD